MNGLDETLASEPGTTSTIGPGTQLGKYKLIRPLGAGAMGQVWAAHDPDLERQVAVKLLKSEKAAPQLRTRLLREARAMARLKHPNVMTVYEVGSVGERDYIVMELVDGTNLDQWLSVTPPPEEVWAALFAAGRGLAAAHRAGLVHRDFKPHNVLRSSDARVLVTDFGLARGVGDEPTAVPALPVGEVGLATTLDVGGDVGGKDSVLDSPLTQTGALIGTPAYMAPEQYLGSPPDPRTDQFSFCVTVWQALTGARPFQGATLDELRRATGRGVTAIKAKLAPRVRAVLARGLDPDPAKRWDSVDDLLDALERARRSRRIWSFAFPAFALLAAGVLFVSMARRHETASPAASSNLCVEPEIAYRYWNDDLRAQLQKRVSGGAADLVSRYLDETRHDWILQYSKACKAAQTPRTYAQIACLLAERDEVGPFVAMVGVLPPEAFARLDVTGELTPVAACEQDPPLGPPQLPEDGKTRLAVSGVRGETSILRFEAPSTLVKDRDRWQRAAEAPGWTPLVVQTDLDIGRAAEMVGEYAIARKYLIEAAARADMLRAFTLKASAQIALLVTESSESSMPGDPGHEQELANEAHDAITRAGGDHEMRIAVEQILAENFIARSEGSHPEALKPIDPWSITSNSPRIVQRLTAMRMRILMAQRHYDEAYELGKKHESDELASGPVHAQIEKYMVQLAWLTGNLDETHARADRLAEIAVPRDSVLLSGEVRDAHGAPVARARVVAWKGTLDGDARRVYTSPGFIGAADLTDDHGAYTVVAPVGGTVIAERDDLRSLPIAIPDGKPMPPLVLIPTSSISDRASGTDRVPALDAFVDVQTTSGIWRDHAPVSSDGSYRITGIPGHAIAVGLERRDGSALHTVIGTGVWPTGATLDVIVKKPGVVKVTRRGVADSTEGPTGPIGFSSETPEGRASYIKGASHLVLHDIAPGEVTVCTSGSQTCTTLTVPASATIAVALE